MNFPMPDLDPRTIKQKYIYVANMNPGIKSKPGKVRPVVVIQSSDTLEAGTSGVVVVPCTTRLQEENILRLRLSPRKGLGLTKPSDILIDEIHTLHRSFFYEELGTLLPEEWDKIKEGVRFLLNDLEL